MHLVRYLNPAVQEWKSQRMVFIGGPRQVGKTFLAKEFLKSPDCYLSWDDLEDREKLRQHKFPPEFKLMVFDEVHKYARWRTLLKGLYDKKHLNQQFIVTGSARLDHFRKGGDSLFGRYHYLRLHPFSVSEVVNEFGNRSLEKLLKYGGFPEPLFKQNDSFSKIWRRERVARVIQQDLRDLTNLKDYSLLEVLADAIPALVGSLLSIKSLAEDLEKSPHTIKNWIEILESVYLCFRILPYGPPRIKAMKKQAKIFLWDWSAVENHGPRFENLVACHLLKFCHFVEDTQGDLMELRFIHDQVGREVDFVVLKNKKPLFAVEVKAGDRDLSSGVRYFRENTNIPKFYQVHLGTRDSGSSQTGHILPFQKFCQLEGLP